MNRRGELRFNMSNSLLFFHKIHQVSSRSNTNIIADDRNENQIKIEEKIIIYVVSHFHMDFRNESFGRWINVSVSLYRERITLELQKFLLQHKLYD